MPKLAVVAAALALLSACASRATPPPACRGEAFSLNAVEAPR